MNGEHLSTRCLCHQNQDRASRKDQDEIGSRSEDSEPQFHAGCCYLENQDRASQQKVRRASDPVQTQEASSSLRADDDRKYSSNSRRRRCGSAPDTRVLDYLHCGRNMPGKGSSETLTSGKRRSNRPGPFNSDSSGRTWRTPPPSAACPLLPLQPSSSSSSRRKNRRQRDSSSSGMYTCQLCHQVKHGKGHCLELTGKTSQRHAGVSRGGRCAARGCCCCEVTDGGQGDEAEAGTEGRKPFAWSSSGGPNCCENWSCHRDQPQDAAPLARGYHRNFTPYRHRSVDFDHAARTRSQEEGDSDKRQRKAVGLNSNENRRLKSWSSVVADFGPSCIPKEAPLSGGRRRRSGRNSRSSPACRLSDSLKDRLSLSSRPSGFQTETSRHADGTSPHWPKESEKRADLSTTTDDDGDVGDHRDDDGDVGDHRDDSSTTLDEDEDDDGDPAAAASSVGPRDSLLMANLSDMWRHHRLCDVILRSQGQEVAAHKLALAAFSEAFARRFCEGQNRDAMVVLDIPDTSPGGIREVLRFVYSGDIRITPDNVAHVLAAASFLHISHVVGLCKEALMQPDVETAIPFSALVEKYHFADTMTFFYDFICKHFLRVSRTRSWKTLSFGHVFDLLSEDNLNVERELDVFQAAVAWIDGDRPNRLTFAADLVGCVRFVYISPEEIAKHVETKHFLFQGDEGKELLLCIYRHHALQTCGCQQGQRHQVLPRRRYVARDVQSKAAASAAGAPPRPTRSRASSGLGPPAGHHRSSSSSNAPPLLPPASTLPSPLLPPPPPPAPPLHHPLSPSLSRESPDAATPVFGGGGGGGGAGGRLLMVGGVDPFHPEEERPMQQVEEFLPAENRWRALSRLPDGRHHLGAAVLAGALYVIGGSVRDDCNPRHLCNPTASCYRYDLASGQWSSMASLTTPRMYHGVAVLSGAIYVVAGQTLQSKLLSSVEYYRPQTDDWDSTAELTEGRLGVAVAAYCGQLFAVGGFLEQRGQHLIRGTVETYCSKTRSWTTKNSLPTPRCHAGLVECQARLYLVGGSTFPPDSATVCSLASILRYDQLDDRWDPIQSLNTPRHDMGVAVFGGRLFVVGGVSSTQNDVLKDVECYDVAGDYWLDDVEPLRSPALGLSCLTTSVDH